MVCMPDVTPWLVDTHCHLDYQAFDLDREAVIERAAAAGVMAIIIPGTNLESSRKAVSLAQTHPGVFAAVGVHPNDANTWQPDTLAELEALAAHPKVVAVGEIGLDFYRQHAAHELQIDILRQQLDLAGRRNLPVILHNRLAEASLLPILMDWLPTRSAPQSPGVLHSFSGSPELARQVLELGFYIGITGPVTFRNAPDMHALVAGLPLERLVVETDAPFLAPHPRRGRRNEPAYVHFTAEKIAALHNCSFEIAAKITTANAQALFPRHEIGESSLA
jgi:TatD DNase family protein